MNNHEILTGGRSAALRVAVLFVCLCATAVCRAAASADTSVTNAGGADNRKATREWVEHNYTKREVMVPMRDGVRLHTTLYEPKAAPDKSPMLFFRTPYKAGPYGQAMNAALWNEWSRYAAEGYIFVMQDVRGRFRSEGVFENVRPFIADKRGKNATDEASDTYDTAEWLLRNAHGNRGNNGRIAMIGTSYCGFYAMMGALSGHKAVKAAVPQAPVSDWFLGDDFHHNGVLMLTDAYSFCPGMNRTRKGPCDDMPWRPRPYSTDEYSYYLGQGCNANLTQQLDSTVLFWPDLMAHTTYDSWWRERCLYRGCRDVRPAVLVVGGTFDAEDCYGAWNLYKTLRDRSPRTDLRLAMGPWAHGAWNAPEARHLGNLRYGQDLNAFYRDSIEFPFLQHFLKDAPDTQAKGGKARVFFSGSDRWHAMERWGDSTATRPLTLYLCADGSLRRQPQQSGREFSEYVSDPAHPVPYTDKTQLSRRAEYMTDDQRFAARRPDVLCFATPPLEEDMTFGGEVTADLNVRVSTTDADFVVKLIDCYPDTFAYAGRYDLPSAQPYPMGGYQLMVRGDIMRGRFRNSFARPEPFVPGQAARVRFTMPDIAHTFRRGHRIMVQVQSSWFPLAERNPQQFVDINTCRPSDFVKADIRILHCGADASSITLRLSNH